MTPVIKIIHRDEVVQGEFRLTHNESNEEAADSMLIKLFTQVVPLMFQVFGDKWVCCRESDPAKLSGMIRHLVQQEKKGEIWLLCHIKKI